MPSLRPYGIGGDYLSGSPIRQDFLETVIDWLSQGNVEGYMAKQQHKPNANELWLYFQAVISWVKTTFPQYRKEMKGIAWGELYNSHKGDEIDSATLEKRVGQLMADDDVTTKGHLPLRFGVLDGRERHLNIRSFSDNQRREAYERQNGICPVCKKHFEIADMHADPMTPWH